VTQNDSANAAGRTGFDRFAGKTKQVVGNIIGDDTLTEEGELQQRKAETAKEAVELTAEAEQREAEARVKAEQSTNRLAQQRVAVELAERQRIARLEQERATTDASIDREAARREEDLDRQHAAEERILDMNESAVVVDLVDDASDAAQLELEAKRAETAADALKAAQRNLEQR
jgi:uncharacterized protein YjbJ (UPF0337 family)